MSVIQYIYVYVNDFMNSFVKISVHYFIMNIEGVVHKIVTQLQLQFNLSDFLHVLSMYGYFY